MWKREGNNLLKLEAVRQMKPVNKTSPILQVCRRAVALPASLLEGIYGLMKKN